jgi:multicomponent K+:H+ antiporter subunit D
MASVLLGLFMAVQLVRHASGGELLVYRLGDWPAPFGIVLVLDRLSALMLLLTYLVAVPVLWYASGGWDTHGRHFHALFQFQLMGLCGAFVTGDLFNLFVFFEVLLIASTCCWCTARAASACAWACTTWCSTWRPRRCS